ncbi:helix-turn-helix domain-containing protein [Actinoallomurus soli]|uniref:helix-turn-helix domain-containing protein n=1 Tax=Actinoallomurus soli TaxID=2952535 RepID=UPI0020926429|nr:helix-turn-helix transcriptional regulator [Actinoallomurus soli]MCO5968108.1 helix-turn-helix domain-containing protein [Actinoallomurus soli]
MTNSSGFVAYFGTELRRHRERLGWPREQLAERVPWSVWTVASVEQGRRKPPPGLGEHADALFNLPGVMTELSKKAQDDNTSFSDLVELEQRVSGICEYDMRLVSGLLQTRSYARAVNQVPGNGLSPQEIDHLVDKRMKRQEILSCRPAPTFHAIIDEAVLCRRIGDTTVMREQLTALTVPRPNLTLQVLPFSAGAHDAVGGPLLLLSIPDEPEVAYADGWARGQLIDTPAEILRARRSFEQLAALALPPDMSAEMIQAYAEEI